jgi:hypothetical protein
MKNLVFISILFLSTACTTHKRIPLALAPIPDIQPVTSGSIQLSAAPYLSPTQTPKSVYYSAFEEINGMLQGRSPVDFKRAVYLTENAWYEDTLSNAWFYGKIKEAEDECSGLAEKYLAKNLEHDPDSQKVCKNAGIYYFMTDTIWSRKGWLKFPVSFPKRYDFNDFMGESDWTNMFVSKLLLSEAGNCHSLPYLYKILADDLGSDCWLAFAPHHIYIKNTNLRFGWYNVELTNGYYPQDAWISASGYISKVAIENRLYMDTIGTRKALTLCLVDLAQGYERKFRRCDNFVLQCAETALKYFPNHVNALVLKAETLHSILEEFMKENNLADLSASATSPETKELYESMNATYTNLYELGYREMPTSMYKNWVGFMKEQQGMQETFKRNKKNKSTNN